MCSDIEEFYYSCCPSHKIKILEIYIQVVSITTFEHTGKDSYTGNIVFRMAARFPLFVAYSRHTIGKHLARSVGHHADILPRIFRKH